MRAIRFFEEGDLRKLLDENSSEDFNDLLKECTDAELEMLFYNSSPEAIFDALDVVELPVLSYIAATVGVRVLARLVEIGGKNFVVKLHKISTRKQFLSIYKNLPLRVRGMVKEAINLIDDAVLVKDLTFADLRLKDYKGHENALLESSSDEILVQINKVKDELAAYQKRESDFRKTQASFEEEIMVLREKLRKQEELNSEQFQEKIEGKVSDFVREAQESLAQKEQDFSKKSGSWGLVGHFSMGAAILAACGSLWYGAQQFDKATGTDKIEWLFFGYLLLKGLIVISLFAALAKHCYTISNAYMHESLKRSDRMHAINFGKFYLEVYGNDVSQVDMKAAFENWNLDSDSAFVKIKPASLEPKVIGEVAKIFESISKASIAKDGKAGS